MLVADAKKEAPIITFKLIYIDTRMKYIFFFVHLVTLVEGLSEVVALTVHG